MANKWIQALKVFNDKKDKWCLPKKGTKDYDKVKAIMEGRKAEPDTKDIGVGGEVKLGRGRPVKIAPPPEKKARGRPKKVQ